MPGETGLPQSLDAAGAGAPGAGSSWTGAGVRAAGGRLGATSFFLAAAIAEPTAAGARGAGDAVGSGVMMLTGGVEAAEGKSALVGFPVGIVGASVATGPGAAAAGIFHCGAYRAIRPS